MLKILFLSIFILNFSSASFASSVLPMSVKERLRLELWYNGIELKKIKTSFGKVTKKSTLPESY